MKLPTSGAYYTLGVEERINGPPNVCIVILGPLKHATLDGERVLADVIKLKILR